MTYAELNSMGISTINNIDEEKAEEIKESILANGWIGCPILIYDGQLLTGSHRLEALWMAAQEDDDIYDLEVAEDVTDIVNANIARREEEEGWAPDIDFGDIGWLLKGSWVEQYKDEIVEW